MPVSGEMSVKSNEAEQRPPSDNLVDLHVSVVPMKHWVEKLNSASHKVIGDTFSAGFIRVLPETSIANLRRDIKLQLGSEIFPKDYVFLKHVGRCLALVRQTQERQLKVKNFLPPHSMLPEVFILPGQPTMYSYSVLPPIQPRLQDLHKSVSDLDSTQTILKSDENVKQLPPMQMSYKLNDEVDSLSPSYNNSPMLKTKAQTSLKRVAYSPKPNNHSPVNTKPNQGGRSPLKSRIPSSVRKRDIKRQQRHVSGKSSIDNEVDHSKSTSAFVLEERGRTTPGQIAIDSQSNVHHQNNEKQNGFINKSQPFPNESGPSQAKSVLREGPKKRRVRYNMPPQSNASSRDDESTDHASMLPPHASQHAIPYPNHITSTPHSSLASSPSRYDGNSYNNAYTDGASVNYNATGRKRRQFVDTSSHALVNQGNRTHWHNLKSDQFAIEHDNSYPSPNSHSPHPMHANHLESDQFGRGEPHLFHPPNSKPGFLTPATGDKWMPATLATARRENQVKSSSANDDSGFVEHESDSGESYKAQNKRKPYDDTAYGDAENVQETPVNSNSTVAPTHEHSAVWKNNNESLFAKHFDSHSRASIPADSWNHHENHHHDQPLPDTPGRQSSCVIPDSGEVCRNVESTFSEKHEEFVSNVNRSTPSAENGNTNHHLTNSASSQDAHALHVERKNVNNLESHELSRDPSHQYNVHDRQNPQSDEQPDQQRSPPSPQPNQGSRLSYRLSEQGFRVQSNTSINKAVHFSSEKNTAESIDRNMEHSPVFFHSSRHDIEEHSYQDDDEEEDSDVDDDENSVDEFQQELAKMKMHRLQDSDHEVVLEPDFAVAEDKADFITEADPSSLNTFEKTRRSFAYNDENKTQDENTPSFSPPGKGIPQRESISGSSEIGKSPLKTVTNVVAFATTDSFHPRNMTQGNVAIDPVVRKLIQEAAMLEGGQSRGAPDGMPMQRKVNTGGTDKPDKTMSHVFNGSNLPEQSVSTRHADILTIVDDGRHSKSPISTQNGYEKDSQNVIKSLKMSSPPDADVVPSFPTSSSFPIRQEKLASRNDKNSRISPTPSPIMVPESGETDARRNETLLSDAPLSDVNDSVAQEQPETRKSPAFATASSPKRLGSSERAKLWKELQHVRSERRRVEKDRQDLVKHAKIVTSKTNQRRNTVRDMWKKKFFEEKKKTMPLQDICRRLQSELDSSHRRLVSAMEGVKPEGDFKKFIPLPPPILAPSIKGRRKSIHSLRKTNNKIQATRLQHDMDNLRRRIEDAKIKLTGEIKLRHQAEQDLKTMRQELLTKKIRAHVAYRDLFRPHPFTVNS